MLGPTQLKAAANRTCAGPRRTQTMVRMTGPGGRVTNAVGTVYRKVFVGTRARPI